MRVLLPLLIVVLAAVVGAEAVAAETGREVPPSPSTAPGVRIWPQPRFTHWPAIVFNDEVRNLSFELPVKRPGASGSVGWHGGTAMPVTLPTDSERIAGLLPLPNQLGTHRADLIVDDEVAQVQVRLADVRQPWPLSRLVDGFPVDGADVPVVLVDRRPDPTGQRAWRLLGTSLPRPQGRPLLVGDPLADLGGDAWHGLDADQRVATDLRYPHHAALVALADLPDPLPRTIVWSPGNGALFGGAWSPEEERVLGALRSRLAAGVAMPRLVLLLPPLPVDDDLHAQAQPCRRTGWGRGCSPAIPSARRGSGSEARLDVHSSA